MIIIGVGGTVLLGSLLVFFKNTPEQAGRKAYGWRKGDVNLVTSGSEYKRSSKRFQGAIYRTNGFWNLINIHFLGCVGHAVILVGIVPMAGIYVFLGGKTEPRERPPRANDCLRTGR